MGKRYAILKDPFGPVAKRTEIEIPNQDLNKGEWDESKHPRGEGGKFGEGTGGAKPSGRTPSQERAATGARAATSMRVARKWLEQPYFKGKPGSPEDDAAKAVQRAVASGFEIPGDKELYEVAQENLANSIYDDKENALPYLSDEEQEEAERDEWSLREVAELAMDKIRDMSINDPEMRENMADALYMMAEQHLEDRKEKKGLIDSTMKKLADLRKEWDESKHPRDASGKFGEGSGGSKEEPSRGRFESREPDGGPSKWGYYGTATERDKQHDQAVESAVGERYAGRGTAAEDKAAEFMASNYGRYLADSIAGLPKGDEKVKQETDRHMKVYEKKVVDLARRTGFEGRDYEGARRHMIVQSGIEDKPEKKK